MALGERKHQHRLHVEAAGAVLQSMRRFVELLP